MGETEQNYLEMASGAFEPSRNPNRIGVDVFCCHILSSIGAHVSISIDSAKVTNAVIVPGDKKMMMNGSKRLLRTCVR